MSATKSTEPQSMETPDATTESETPIRVCRKCSTQARTAGESLPFCTARYSKRTHSRKQRILVFGAPLLVLVIAGGTAGALTVRHNNHIAAQKREAAQASARRAAAQRAAQAEAQRLKKAQADSKRALAKLERLSIVSDLENAVKKDAEKDVNDGLLDGPILKVQCEPATTGDATATIANYSCIAAKSETGGTLEGYRFSALINTQTGSISWHLGG